MKKINLKGISEILSEKELKNVMGGTDGCGNRNSGCNGTCRKMDGSGGTCYVNPTSEVVCGCR